MTNSAVSSGLYGFQPLLLLDVIRVDRHTSERLRRIGRPAAARIVK